MTKKMNLDIENIIEKLLFHIKKEKYKGYDPYDALNSFIPFRYFGHTAQVLAIQTQVRNPINLRKFIGIKKEYSIKSIGILLHALSVYYTTNQRNDILQEMRFLFHLLKEKRIKNHEFEGIYWAVHYPIAWKTWERPKFDPSAVLASVVFEGIFEYYKATGDDEAKDILEGIGIFLRSSVPITENKYGKCYSYTTRKKEIVYNANMYVCEVFSKLYYITQDKFYKDEALTLIKFNLHYQRDNGSWGYRLYSDNSEREQIDFHQGFIINSLAESLKYLDLKEQENIEKINKALQKAYAFYLKKQFTLDGKGFWRYPGLYPIDIHNQAVGIWIGSKFYKDFQNIVTKENVQNILIWTVSNLYNKKEGYFYYQKRRLFTNRIDYIRWNQSWMLLGLVHYYKFIKLNYNAK